MFDIAWSELLILMVVALVVVGPKDLPKLMRTLGQWMAKARDMARQFQGAVDQMMRESELDQLRKEVSSLREERVSLGLDEPAVNDAGPKPAAPAVPAQPSPPAPPAVSAAATAEGGFTGPPP